MPSLIPVRRSKPLPTPMVDVGTLFGDAAFADSVDRVINYLDAVDSKLGDGSFERVTTPWIAVEQFFLFMPTHDAYLTEIELCDAIAQHSNGNLPDSGLRSACNSFISTHTFVFTNSGSDRQLVSGKWLPWASVPLVLCTWPDAKGAPCNIIQAWIAFLLQKKHKPELLFSWERL